MSLEDWLTFVAISAVLIASPGPSILYVLGVAVSGGAKDSILAVLGVGIGVVVMIFLSLSGLGALVSASREAFWVLKVIGGIYLVILGIQKWKGKQTASLIKRESGGKYSSNIVRQSALVAMLNPAVLIFYIAFLPQFISDDGHFFSQALILGASFSALSILIAGSWATFAVYVRTLLIDGRVEIYLNSVAALLLISAGAFVLLSAGR